MSLFVPSGCLQFPTVKDFSRVVRVWSSQDSLFLCKVSHIWKHSVRSSVCSMRYWYKRSNVVQIIGVMVYRYSIIDCNKLWFRTFSVSKYINFFQLYVLIINIQFWLFFPFDNMLSLYGAVYFNNPILVSQHIKQVHSHTAVWYYEKPGLLYIFGTFPIFVHLAATVFTCLLTPNQVLLQVNVLLTKICGTHLVCWVWRL